NFSASLFRHHHMVASRHRTMEVGSRHLSLVPTRRSLACQFSRALIIQMPSQSAYIVAARRTAIGRIGGLHRNRRIEELCAPLVGVALQDSGLEPGQVDELIVGNASQGGNPARLIALAAGLPE